jgi:hypothetical protein
LTLGSRNLIVGKNASGKTRALNIITGLARQLSGQEILRSGNFRAEFQDGRETYTYELRYDQQEVVHEKYTIGSKVYLDRGAEGKGVIWADEIEKGSEVVFQAPVSVLAAVVRRDSIQHKFLESLHTWATSVRRYNFGSPLGKDHLAVFLDKGGAMPDERDQNAVVALYRLGEKNFGEQFKKAVIADMAAVDYPLESITVGPPLSIRFVSATEAHGLLVKEKGLRGQTDQNAMSQGMFRVLSLLIHVNYGHFAKRTTTILIDDIGEGLDFDRSCRLIDLLRRKTESSGVQLIMATNDRFVMNRVPLEEWSVLTRFGNRVKVRNAINSKKIFEEFKFTGLSNFSFFELDVVNDPKAADA